MAVSGARVVDDAREVGDATLLVCGEWERVDSGERKLRCGRNGGRDARTRREDVCANGQPTRIFGGDNFEIGRGSNNQMFMPR
jgi:hypothetical protein